MAKKFLVLRLIQTVRGGSLQIPLAEADSEAEAKRYADERNAELEQVAGLIVVGVGPGNKAQPIGPLGQVIGQSLGITNIGHTIAVIEEIGAPNILVPKPGIILTGS